MILVIVDLNDLTEGRGEVPLPELAPQDWVVRFRGIAGTFAICEIYDSTRFEFVFFDVGKAWPEICAATSAWFQMNVLSGLELLHRSHFGVHVNDRELNAKDVSNAFHFAPKLVDQFAIDAARGIHDQNDAPCFCRFQHRQAETLTVKTNRPFRP